MMKDEIDIPPYFLCPISLEIMKDPVIVSTGITYDRENIEKWMFSSKKDTCPVAKQVLDTDLTPNHTLRRLIQAWCTLNASYGIERIPTPKPPVDATQIMNVIITSNKVMSTGAQLKALRSLKLIAAESDRNKKCIESAGGVEFLVSIVKSNNSKSEDDGGLDQSARASDEALYILYNLQMSEASLKSLVGRNGEFLESLVQVLRNGSYESRAYAVMILRRMLQVSDPIKLISLKAEIVTEVVHVLRDQISLQAFKSALHILIQVCPWGRNKIKAVDAGAVSILIETLLDNSDKRVNEMMMVVLDLICGCAEGRSELLKHCAGLAVVSKKILRVSKVVSERAVRILSSISRFSATSSVVQEMLQVGVVSKLCLVIQVECTLKTKEKAKEILRLHSRAWRNSPCVPSHLLTSYPY